MTEQAAEAVFAAIRAIPAGKVMSYGDVAEYVGLNSARIVGRLLATSGEEEEDLPWFRVVRADGTAAPHIRAEQVQRLRAEGTLTTSERVDMKAKRWDGR